jgi:hypothetical protein
LCFLIGCTSKNNSSSGSSQENDDGIYSITYFQSEDYVLNGPEEARAGTDVTFTLNEIKEGYCLDYFLINNTVSNSNTFVMPSYNSFVEAVLTPVEDTTFPVILNQSDNGVMATNVETAKPGTEIPLYVEANEGYRLNKITANGVELTIQNNGNRRYYAQTIMQNKSLVVESEFVRLEHQMTDYEFSLRSGDSSNSATSYWKFKYDQNGINVEVCVTDSTPVYNGSLSVWQRDNIEFQMCLATESNRPRDAKVIRCLLACDGRYYMQRVRSDSAYYPYGRYVDYQYGKNFFNDAVLCTQEVNGFDGYVVKAFFGYDIFDTNYEEAYGHMTFAPAMRDATLYNYSTGKLTSVWKSTSTTMAVAYMGIYINSDYHCQWFNPRTYININSDGSLTDRYLTLDTDLLFMGDSYTIVTRYGSMYDDFSDLKVSTVGFGASQTTDWLANNAKALNLVQIVNPRNIAVHIGGNDLYGSANLDTTIANAKQMVSHMLDSCPEAKIYLMTLAIRNYNVSTAQTTKINTFNSSITSFYENNARVKVINITDGLLDYGNMPHPGVFTDNTHMNAFGYAMVSNLIREAMGLSKLSDSERFGSFNKVWATNGFTNEEKDGHFYLRQRNSMATFGDRYIYFKQDHSTETKFTAGAEFNIGGSNSYNGDNAPKFGFILNDGVSQLFFYVDTTEYFEKKLVGISSRISGVYDWNYVPASTYNIYFTNEDYTKLEIKKNGSTLEFFVNGYKISEKTPTFLENDYSIGFFSFNLPLNIRDPYLVVGEK